MCRGVNQIIGESLPGSVTLGGAVLSFQLVGITALMDFFATPLNKSPFLVPLQEHKNITLLELLEREPHFPVAPKVFSACSFLFQSD